MEATENVQATDNGIENAETSEEVKVQKSGQSVRGRQGQNGYWALWHSFAERINATMTE